MKQLSGCSHRLGDVYDIQRRTASIWRDLAEGHQQVLIIALTDVTRTPMGPAPR